MGKVVSDLVRGPQPEISDCERHGFPVFEVSADAEPINDEMVATALEDAGIKELPPEQARSTVVEIPTGQE